MKQNKNPIYAAAYMGMAFFGIAFIVMGSVLPSLTAKYSLNAVEASSLVTFLPVGVLLGSLVFGPVVDRWGYKPLLILSTLSIILGLEGLAFLDRLGVLRFCIFLIGLGGGMLNGATNALVSEISDDRNRASRLSVLGVFYGVGALGMPFLMGVLSGAYAWEVILRWMGIAMFASVVYFAAVGFPEPKIRQSFPVRQALGLFRQPLLLIMSLFLFFQSGLEGLFNNWTTSYLEGTPEAGRHSVILLLTFFVLGMTLARVLLSWLLRVVRNVPVLAAGMAVALAGIAVLYYSSNPAIAAAGLFAAGFGLAAGFPVTVGIIGSAYRETTGTAIGVALFIALCGNSILNYAMGHITEAFGMRSFPIFVAVLLVLQAAIVFTNKKRFAG